MTEAQKAKEVDSEMRLKSQKVDVLMKIGWKSYAVMCNAAVDVESGVIQICPTIQ